MIHFYRQARRGNYSRRASLRLAIADWAVYVAARIGARFGRVS